jgi:hypothetical protein
MLLKQLIIMNLFIPEIGTQLELIEDWTFILYPEYRNKQLMLKLDPTSNCNNNVKVNISKGTVLSVDRIYIKKNVSDYSAITFKIDIKFNKKHPLSKSRFWAKLSDVNKIKFKFIDYNQETLDIIKELDEKSKAVMKPVIQSKLMKLFLNGKTVNNFIANMTPKDFINNLLITYEELIKTRRLAKYYTLTDDDIIKINDILKTYIRLYKITCFID